MSSSSSNPATAAIANDAVAIALVSGWFRASDAVGGSQTLVSKSGRPGMWRARKFVANLAEMVGLKLFIFFPRVLFWYRLEYRLGCRLGVDWG